MHIEYAALTFEIAPGQGAIQLTPAGVFKARDGRPQNLPGWKMDAGIAAKVIARAAARKTPFVIDYEHQTLAAEKNGQPAPAAGWFKSLEWREGQGLFATDVSWTDKAKAHIDAGEYKFISPVLAFNKQSGDVVQIEMAAVTNNPALDGMDAVSALATQFFNRPDAGQDHTGAIQMKSVITALGLAEDANEEAVLAAVTALKSRADTQETEIADLKTKQADPAKFVPVATVTALQTEVATLTARLNDGELAEVIAKGKTDGKILPATEEWARDLGKKDLAALKTFLEKTPAVAALKGTQTGGKAPDGDKLDQTDAEAISKAALKYQAEQAAAGNPLTAAQAVAHVTKEA